MNSISDLHNLSVVEKALATGAVVAYPTETSYGLGCDATNREAVQKIFTIKGREIGKPLLVIVSELAQIKPYIVWDERLEIINKKYWPGPLTVVVEAKTPSTLADGVLSTAGLVAFRVTSHPIAHSLVAALGKPLVSTSANLAGDPPLYSAAEIVATFGAKKDQPDILIDAGKLPKNLPSTIITLVPDGIEIVRQGTLTVEL